MGCAPPTHETQTIGGDFSAAEQGWIRWYVSHGRVLYPPTCIPVPRGVVYVAQAVS